MCAERPFDDEPSGSDASTDALRVGCFWSVLQRTTTDRPTTVVMRQAGEGMREYGRRAEELTRDTLA